jgi:hypothetical protein
MLRQERDVSAEAHVWLYYKHNSANAKNSHFAKRGDLRIVATLDARRRRAPAGVGGGAIPLFSSQLRRYWRGRRVWRWPLTPTWFEIVPLPFDSSRRFGEAPSLLLFWRYRGRSTKQHLSGRRRSMVCSRSNSLVPNDDTRRVNIFTRRSPKVWLVCCLWIFFVLFCRILKLCSFFVCFVRFLPWLTVRTIIGRFLPDLASRSVEGLCVLIFAGRASNSVLIFEFDGFSGLAHADQIAYCYSLLIVRPWILNIPTVHVKICKNTFLYPASTTLPEKLCREFGLVQKT